MGLNEVVEKLKAQGLFTDADVAKGVNGKPDKSISHAKETYERLYKIGDVLYNDYDSKAEDLPNLMTLLSSGCIFIKYIGVTCLRFTLYKFCKLLQGDLFFNKEFVGALVGQMTNEDNVLIANEFANCVSSIAKTERGVALTNLVRECHYPVASILSIQKAARDYHTYARNEKIRDSFIELITTNLWTIGILCAE